MIAIAGEDSLQALVLALEFVTLNLPADAKRSGGSIDWLGERESPVFAGTLMREAQARALGRLVNGIRSAADFIKRSSGDGGQGSRQLIRRLESLAKTWGAKG
jgi:hypothetical protein